MKLGTYLRHLWPWILIQFILVVGMVWVRTANVKATYRFVQLEKELTQLEQEIQAGRVKWLQLTTPQKLEVLASRLELKPPHPDQSFKYPMTKP